MLLCRKCGDRFPSSVKVDGLRRIFSSRKYCLNCSPFGGHNTRRIHVGMAKLGRSLVCKRCRRDYVYRRNGSSPNFCAACNATTRKALVKQKAVALLGGKCWICGYSRCLAALDFHHLDPSSKDFTVSRNANRNWYSVQKELFKCALLCCRCHREVETGLIECPPRLHKGSA